MRVRSLVVLNALLFVGLSSPATPAMAQSAEQVEAVLRLKAQADELLKKGDKSEAAERYKDCVCLIELQKWDPVKKREFLLRASNEKPDPQVRTLFGKNPSKYLFGREILQTIHVKSASDLSTVNELIKSAQFSGSENDDLAHRLLEEISEVNASKPQDRRTQLDALQFLFQAMGNQGAYGRAQAKMKSLALEIDPTTDDKLASQQSRVLWVVLNTFRSRSEAPETIGNVQTLRQTILECIALMERFPGKIHVDLSSAIAKAMSVDRLSALTPILERYLELQKAVYRNQPELYQTERCHLGWAYLDAGRYDDAERLFKDISAACKNNSYALNTYEFSELSLGSCYMMQRKFGKATHHLKGLMSFLAAPRIVDINHYGAMAEGMLGEIAINSHAWKTARRHLERADERMPILINIRPSFESISFIRSNIPSEVSVLRNLVEVYSQLGLNSKAAESSKFLESAKSAESSYKLSVSLQDANRQVNRAFHQNSSVLVESIESYLPALLKSTADRKNIFESLMTLIDRCQERGASSAGLMCIEEALRFEDSVLLKDQRDRLIMLKAQFLVAQDKFETARRELSELTSNTKVPAATQWIASSLVAESHLREGNTSEAEDELRTLIQNAEHASSATETTSEENSLYDTNNGASLLAGYVSAAYTNLGEILISKGQTADAESKLKQFVTRRSLFFGKELAASTSDSLANALLAYAEALQGKRSESELNLRTAFSSRRIAEGFDAARTKKFAGLTYKELGDPDRGRRLLYEALQEYETILPTEDLEVKSCRANLEAITPGLSF